MNLGMMQRGLFRALDSVMPPSVDVAWDYGSPTGDDMPPAMLRLSLAAGPSPETRQHARAQAVTVANAAAVLIGPVTPGDVACVVVGGLLVRVDVGPGDTPPDVRDAVLDAVAGMGEPVAAAPVGASSIALTAQAPGALYGLAASGVASIASTSGAENLAMVAGIQTATVEVQAFGTAGNMSTPTNAQQICARALAALQTQSVSDTLAREYGVALRAKGSPTDLSAIAGASWESRAVFTFGISLMLRNFNPVDVIEHAEATITTDAGTFTAST